MASSPESENEYRRSIFTPPGRSGTLSRLFFYWYNRSLDALFGPDDLTALLRAGALALGLAVLIVILISFSPYDPFLVLVDAGYEEPSIILAKDRNGGNVRIAEFYRLDRKVLHLDKAAARNFKIVRALIAMEDNNFYKHPGVDVSGIARAMFVNLISGDIREGASTITQQVARLRFLSSERTFARKAREAVLALFLELRYSKDQIMELYLNEVPLGHGTIGVEAAAKFYFNKSTSDLEWGEAAVLASLTTRPQEFSPLRDIKESRRKVRVVFRKLVETGELSRDDAEKAYSQLETDFYAELNRSPNDTAFNTRLNLHPYVTEYVKSMIPPELQGRLYTGGLRIYTTIQDDHQTAAEEALIPQL
ncbi:MAG: transglycosylase domain-containing protein, partial [Spirochaetia bacterium]|nr:transglycosylase domain-containing protein [Spirochaetia bacterium]